MKADVKAKIISWLTSTRTLFGLWMVLAVVSGIMKMKPDRCNNFLVFKGVFWHTIDQTSLYATYPSEYFDINHYGPLFSIIIAPFALLPHPVGLVFWQVAMTLMLFIAIRKLPVPEKTQIFMLWFCAHELLTALFMQQFNIVIAAIILLAFLFVEKGKDQYATLFIVIGTLVKIYGIVGLAFFFFSKNKKTFVLSLVGWSVVLFLLPMIISSPEYVLEQYKEWYINLAEKNGDNTLSVAQNISLLGIVRKLICLMTGGQVVDGVWQGGYGLGYSDILLILPGMLVMAIGYFRIGQWKNQLFRQTVLAGILMFVVLFSTGSESSGYVIALAGCCLWYCSVPWKRGKWDVALLVFAFVLTSLSPSDLFPRTLRHDWIQPLALKALPVVLIWIKMCYEFITKDYDTAKL